jgi:hypothetical protein
MVTKKIKIEIKNRLTGKILFEYEKESNEIKETLIEAVKKGADLSCAYLRGADLSCAYLRGADLSCAYLRGADLNGAYLRGADLNGADLSGAYLRGADLNGADLSGAKNIPFIPMYCPSDGAFIGWKKVKYQDGEYLVKLEIQEDSKRSSATRTKCRCDKAKVLDIILINFIVPEEFQTVKPKEIVNANYKETRYAIGEMVYADSWDEDRWKECSHGIHFFINKQEAIDYEI